MYAQSSDQVSISYADAETAIGDDDVQTADDDNDEGFEEQTADVEDYTIPSLKDNLPTLQSHTPKSTHSQIQSNTYFYLIEGSKPLKSRGKVVMVISYNVKIMYMKMYCMLCWLQINLSWWCKVTHQQQSWNSRFKSWLRSLLHNNSTCNTDKLDYNTFCLK